MKHFYLKKTITFILCLTLMFGQTVCWYSGNVRADELPAGTTTENLMPNGYFEEGLSSWSTYFNEPYSGSAEITSDYFAKYDISFFLNWYGDDGKDNGPVTWCIMLENKGLNVTAGKKYHIVFDAQCTVERPIMVEITRKNGYEDITEMKQFFKLEQEYNTYSFDYNCTVSGIKSMKLHFGPIPNNEAGNDTGCEITSDNFTAHSIQVGKFSMVDVTDGDVQFVKTPGIIGVESDVTYKAPVMPEYNYDGEYTVDVSKNGEKIEYAIGDTLYDDGSYEIRVSDKANPSICTVKTFVIKKDIDYNKTYYAILSKATDRVIEASGIKENGAIVQNRFSGKMGQFFTIENISISNGYFVIKSLSSGKVITADSSGKLVQQTYTGSNSQLWKKVTVPQGFVKFENKNSGKVIDIPGANSIDNLQLQEYTNSGVGDEGQNSKDAQRFDIIKIKNIKEYIEGKKEAVTNEADWTTNAFITPRSNKLNPAGPIAVEWYSAPGDVDHYDIYFNGIKAKTVQATGDKILKVEDNDIYSTKVAQHTMKIVAVYADGRELGTLDNNFFISKKGVGWGTLHRTDDLNLSWYYRWSTDPALGTDENLTFVPMIWGNYGDEWLANPENQKYGTVLSFNEPDWSDQSNVPVTKELASAWADRYNAANGTNITPPKSLEEAWQSFMDSGLRIGSPATALAPPYCLGQITMNNIDGPDTWWANFEQLMRDNADKGWDYDFVAIHSYNGGADVQSFVKMLEDTHNMTGKPIWITEFGVADWGSAIWNAKTNGSNEKVYKFMEELLPILDQLAYVERYAWFPFDPNDAYGGSSGIFNYDNGSLNKLGKLYATLGLPEGYKAAVDYTDDLKEQTTTNNSGKEQSTSKKDNNTSQNKQETTTGKSAKVSRPERAKITNLTSKKKKVKITIKKHKKQSKVKGYQIVWSKTKKFKKTKKMFTKKVKLTINKFKKIKKGTKYYFKVRAYKVVNGKKLYGKYSKVKKVRIK